MTNPRISPAGISALAALVHEARPDWDRRGIAGVLHKLADTVPVADLTIAAMRAATDPTNDTPEAFAHLNNRAWDTDWWTPCKTHPETRTRTLAGECASCRADRLGTDGNTQPLQRHCGDPLDPALREQMLTEIHRPHHVPQRERPKPADNEALAAIRAELSRQHLDAAREHADTREDVSP